MERIIDIAVTPISDDAELVAAFNDNFSMDEFKAALVEALGPDYDNLAQFETDLENGLYQDNGNAQIEGLSTCLQQCKADHTDANGNKMPGRGACKFGCWVKAVKAVFITVGNAIGDVVDALV